MRTVIQRVTEASVSVHGELAGRIDGGLLVLLAVRKDDSELDLNWMVRKTVGLRVFPDCNGKMNLNVEQVGGSVLVVSQFTLFGDCSKGMRPSFDLAAAPEMAEKLYLRFVAMLREAGIRTECGVFRADMEVKLVNHGPVTLVLDSKGMVE
jgi:D-tyrosyl-tRNA(Tyr) deacylase